MQFQLSGQHVDITEAMRAHVTDQLDRLTRLDDRLTSLAVVLSLDKLQQKAEGTLHTSSGALLHAEAFEPDMYISIDMMFDKLVTQLRKHREKVCDKHKAEVRRDERLYG